MPRNTLATARRSAQLTAALRPPLLDRAPLEGPGAAEPVAPPAALVLLPNIGKRSAWLHQVATLDFGGRFYPADAIAHLGWKPGSAVLLRMDGARIVVEKTTRRARVADGARRISLDARGRLCLPDAFRQWLGVEPGDRIAVATNRRTKKVLIASARVIDNVLRARANRC